MLLCVFDVLDIIYLQRFVTFDYTMDTMTTMTAIAYVHKSVQGERTAPGVQFVQLFCLVVVARDRVTIILAGSRAGDSKGSRGKGENADPAAGQS